jgi:DNA invertase Pin-like site-specific DNA recombinase
MTSANEPAGTWVRVSSGGQDEENQVPEVEGHCAARGYLITRRYVLNDKRASVGEQQAKLDEMLQDMRDGIIKVLVFWHSDRLERRGSEYLQRDIRLIRDAGGRPESVKEPWLGNDDISGEVMTAIAGTFSHQFIVHLKDQVRLAHDRIRANGGVGPGGTPWGYKVIGPKYQKELVPTDLCREYAPQIFQRAIDGESYREIATWLDSQGVPPKRSEQWHEGSVRKLIRNRIYAGRWQNEAKTITTVRSTAVVKADVWERANAATNRQPNRRPVSKNNRSLLANLLCNRCEDSPMNLIQIKDRYGKYYTYYRCTGRGARRKGCGNMIPLEPLERVVRLWVLVMSNKPHQVRDWIEGTNWDSEIADVKQDQREALEAEDMPRVLELQAQLDDYRGRKVIPGHWDYKDTDLTIGQYFASLDHDGQREYLRSRHDIRAEKLPEGQPGGWAAGRGAFRLVIDGEECDGERFAAADRAFAARIGRLV